MSGWEVATRQIDIARMGGDYIALQIHTGKKATRIFLTEEQAMDVAYRLMAFGSGHIGSERAVAIEQEPS